MANKHLNTCTFKLWNEPSWWLYLTQEILNLDTEEEEEVLSMQNQPNLD
jgi:hypothetical protein